MEKTPDSLRLAALKYIKMADGLEKSEVLIYGLLETSEIWCCGNDIGPLKKEFKWFRDEATREEFVPIFSSREVIEDVFAALNMAPGSFKPPFFSIRPAVFFFLIKVMKFQVRLNPFTGSEVRLSVEQVSRLAESLPIYLRDKELGLS